MSFFAKIMNDSSASASSTGKPPPTTSHSTLGSREVFIAWAKDSFLNQSTVDILIKTHEIDCLPAVLALKKEDFSHLDLPVGQRRLLENAAEKLRQEFEVVRPVTTKAKINLQMPSYKSMLEIREMVDKDAGTIGKGQHKISSIYDFRGLQKLSEHDKSQRKSLKDECDSGPEHEALLVSEKGTKSAQMQAGSQTDSRCFENLNDDSDDDESTACACQKWLFVTIFMPLILILSILGSLLLMVSAPFQLCCPEGGVYNKMVIFLFEVLLKAPCVACKWAAGKNKHNSATGKPRYGGTDDIELGEK
ncbi:uncharacterized protein LOC122959702 [Acropora millepora]|uniref:uncharacterized protein LOC122959702 n=1 Tax=Acropora millepora TaxID=45264 RepID=UPI001CF1DEE4|nr:uncharacterized protein LOC122959702 [Acropora millepora]